MRSPIPTRRWHPLVLMQLRMFEDQGWSQTNRVGAGVRGDVASERGSTRYRNNNGTLATNLHTRFMHHKLRHSSVKIILSIGQSK